MGRHAVAQPSTRSAGYPAPDFELLDQHNTAFKLSDRRGKAAVVIALHPMASLERSVHRQRRIVARRRGYRTITRQAGPDGSR